ncbi:MAG: MauE/DoxX family redox-associated membrane protein [Desulfovibrionaceae bacterium]|jgi:hypothetical protein|uniref:MauE/DoxX family redox-associated membrane protein n=1 Tax=Desulfovibrio aminophilus TaxID=81425 RepID=UPI000408D5A5|nr:MauE/DoxX family redox-associated membrane protein [Desulfovibrio aminophilus]MDY0306191.1 MauE/DoxX family redox-associated membrane protein [Desulfovibrionaceae bacterium]
MKHIRLLLRVTLGLVFLAACWDKLLHPEAFGRIILNYRILPGALVAPLAVLLPWLELLCGLALIVGALSSGAALLCVLFMATFLTAEASALWRGLDIVCGCFSTDPSASGSLSLAMLRDSGLLLLSLAVLSFSQKRQRAE